jgi:hypothetical protein
MGSVYAVVCKNISSVHEVTSHVVSLVDDICVESFINQIKLLGGCDFRRLKSMKVSRKLKYSLRRNVLKRP